MHYVMIYINNIVIIIKLESINNHFKKQYFVYLRLAIKLLIKSIKFSTLLKFKIFLISY